MKNFIQNRPFRLFLATISLLLIFIAWQRVTTPTDGLIIEETTAAHVPLRYVLPQNAQNAPAVIIAHGFAGSSELMLAYSYVFAHAGYVTLLLDFDGHAANSVPLSFDPDTNERDNNLQTNLNLAYDHLLTRPEIDPNRIALLGHSMGSGAVMRNAIAHPERYTAVLPISPTSADVTPNLPPNMHLQAGQYEAPFVANAEQLLADAGGPNDDLTTGRARQFTLIPNVEHISILFSPQSHQAALNWLNRTNNWQTQTPYQDGRILWYAFHLTAVLTLALTLKPLIPLQPNPPPTKPSTTWRRWLLLATAPFIATALIFTLNFLTPMQSVGGLLVGGALALWFLVMGLIWLAATPSPNTPKPTDFLWGFALFALLTAAFGLMAHIVWLPWWMIPTRLLRFPFLALAMLPWLLALAQQLNGRPTGRWFAAWLGQTVIFITALILLALTIPALGFVILVIPLLPLIIALMMLSGSLVSPRPWPFAFGNAAFFGWLLAVLFPLAG